MAHITIETDCYHEACYVCGLPIYIPRNMERRLRDKGETFFCPAGHQLGFGTGEVARLQSEIAALTAQRNLAERNLDAARREVKRITKRVEAGVCLHCKRTFTNLARHMKTEHGPKKGAKK